MKADHLVSRLLTVPREERARVLEQEGPESWDSVLFFAVRDGLRYARFHGQMSAADYIDTLEEVERHYDEDAGTSAPDRTTASDESDDQTIDLVPAEADEPAEDSHNTTAHAARIEEVTRREPAIVARIEQPTRREPAIVGRIEQPTRREPVIPERIEEPIRREPVIPERFEEPIRREPAIIERRPSGDRPTPEHAASRATATTELRQSVSAPVPAPKVEFVTGATIRDRYVLDHQIGKGGSGIVFRARDVRRDGLVALKVLREELRSDPVKIERLKREFQQTQALPHPNIIRVFDVDCEGDAWFLTMELIDGESLRSHLASIHPRRLPQRNALTIILACADALSFAHQHDIVHGDFKPGNVLLGRDRQIRVLDFGAVGSSADPWSGRGSQASERHVAAATPAYASPEVLHGDPPQVRDDVYSFACVAYEVLTRQHPFERHSALVARQRGMKVRRLPGLTRRRFAALKRGLAWTRNSRPATVLELADELREPSPQRRPFVFWFAAMTVALAAVVAVAFLLNGEQTVPATPPATSEVAGTTTTFAEPAAQQSAPPPATAPLTSDTRTTEQRASSPTTAQPGARLANPAAPVASPEPSTLTNAATPKAATAPSAADVAATTEVIQQSLARGGTVSLQQANIVVSERASQAVIRVQRRNDFLGRIRVQWRTIPGTAQPGIDYSDVTSGSLTIPEDQDIRVIYIPLMYDGARESNEWFELELTDVSGPARLGPITLTRVTILDD
jgi:serine/threonine protein kinase